MPASEPYAEILVHEVIDHAHSPTLKHLFFDNWVEAQEYISRFTSERRRKQLTYIHRHWGVGEVAKCWVEDRRTAPRPTNIVAIQPTESEELGGPS